jgi:hypothetical protein
MRNLSLSFLFIGLFIFALNANSQTVSKADTRLSDVFGKVYVDNLIKTDAAKIAFYNYYLENSYYTTTLNLPKPVTGTDIHTVVSKNDNSKLFSETVFNKKTFNPLKYDFKVEENNFKTYIWQEAGIAIIFHPMSHIRSDFENFKKSKK